jgi:hypothetical protein
MKNWKIALITALSAVGLFAASAAHAQEYNYGYYRPTTVARPVVRRTPRYRSVWYRGRWVRRPIYVTPVVQAQPVYTQPVYSQPVYTQPVNDNGCNEFSDQIRNELSQLESAVRERVYGGELDGSALTAMENAREDISQDVVDVSAKGYITDADRTHIENDIAKLRTQFGCA